MNRTTVTIEDEKLDALKAMAAERGVSVSLLVREAIEEMLAGRESPSRRHRRQALGLGWPRESIPARTQ